MWRTNLDAFGVASLRLLRAQIRRQRKLRFVSQCGPYCRYMAMREYLAGAGAGVGVIGWVLISLNNTFLLESITQKVKILLVSSFKWYFSPRSMLSTGCMSWSLKKNKQTKKQMLQCTLSSGCVTFLYRTTWFSCLYMFVLLHAVKWNDRRMHTGISLYYGSKSAARPSQTNDIRTILCMSSYGKGGWS